MCKLTLSGVLFAFTVKNYSQSNLLTLAPLLMLLTYMRYGLEGGRGHTIWVIHKKYRNLFLTSPLTINWITHLGLPCSSLSFSPTWQCCDDLKFNPWNPIGLKNSLIITTYSEWSKIMVTSYWFEKFECTGECLIMMKPVILIMSSHSNPCLLM